MNGQECVTACLGFGRGDMAADPEKRTCLEEESVRTLVTQLFHELVQQNDKDDKRSMCSNSSMQELNCSSRGNKIPRASAQQLQQLQETFEQEIRMLNTSLHDLMEMTSTELRELTGTRAGTPSHTVLH